MKSETVCGSSRGSSWMGGHLSSAWGIHGEYKFFWIVIRPWSSARYCLAGYI